MSEISQELVERMVAFIRWYDSGTHQPEGGAIAEARAIVAELPVPVDPDLLEAREIAADRWDREQMDSWAHNVLSGARDSHTDVQLALKAIKRGRELSGERP